ncbi:M12 family metallopeptidase [Paludisphaera mucosa]|uniref:M12 family metallopeptidase n=1 Tax=Paludisphaera mucosa TaxID=3030827 RepID=A0ABT6FJQ8_9BACT|nr:M12 family metallopeptidase [Paludisphaera mucosa]MDG3007790.1 M12 family metallopeptidase [Paludisphaera mucosa]
MKHRKRPLVLGSCAAATAAALVASGLTTAPGAGLAQEPPPPPAPQAAGALAPMLGGRLPTPSLPVTITWDARFRPVEAKAAVVGPYVVIEGDMIVGTTDDVGNALMNGAIAAAQDFEKSPNKQDVRLPAGLRESADRLTRQLAAQPKRKTRLTAPAAGQAEFQRLLQAVRRYEAARRVLRSAGPADGGEMPKESSDALEHFATAAHALEPQEGASPPPPGDPGPSVAAALAILDTRFYWPGGVVPYFIDPSYEPFRPRFEAACRLWMDQTSAVAFRPYRPGDPNYLYVHLVTGDAGSSSVGMYSGGQWLNLLHPDRFPESHIAHELGHALGLFHEQSRPDRPSHLSLIENNIQQGWISQFTTPVQDFTTQGTGFDFFSIMLYDSRAGSVNPNAVDASFRPVYPVYSIPATWRDYYRTKYNFALTTDVIGLGNVKKPSLYDVVAVNKMYGPAAAGAAAAAPALPLPPAPPAGPGGAPPRPEPPFPSLPSSLGFAPMAEVASAPAAAAAPEASAGPAAVSVSPRGGPANGVITVTVTIPYPEAGATTAGGGAAVAGRADVATGGGDAVPPDDAAGADPFGGPSPPPGYMPPPAAARPAPAAPTNAPAAGRGPEGGGAPRVLKRSPGARDEASEDGAHPPTPTALPPRAYLWVSLGAGFGFGASGVAAAGAAVGGGGGSPTPPSSTGGLCPGPPPAGGVSC